MDRPICYCFGVSEGRLRRLIAEQHLTTMAEVRRHCRAGSGCGACQADVAALLGESTGQPPPDAPPKPLGEAPWP